MPEQQNIEWKESWRDEYLKWICGFANAQGGKLYIDVNRLTEGEKEYIEIDVPPYPIGISCKGVYHYRSGSTKQVLTGPALEAFLMRKHGATWDHSPLPVFKAEEVDDQIVEHFKKLAAAKGRIDPALLNEPKEVLMEKLRLTNGDYLTNAAMLLFCKDPDKYQLGSYIKIGYFESDSELLYQDEVHGSILEQVDKAIELIYFKYMRAKITYEGIYRRERYFVPEAALREALLNAICHKQYESRIPIQVSVYDDRLYVANVGRLPENWTLENLMGKHASLPYNPDIAHIFYLAGFIESWGRGIEKICDSLKADNLPMPEYTVHPGDIMIKFTGPEDRIVRVNNKVNDRVNVHVNDRESALLNYLAQDPGYTVTQLAEMMNVSRKTIAGYLKALKDKGVIERIGTTRTGYWKIK